MTAWGGPRRWSGGVGRGGSALSRHAQGLERAGVLMSTMRDVAMAAVSAGQERLAAAVDGAGALGALVERVGPA